MGQVHHGSATTTAAVRRAIQNSQESLRALARGVGVIGSIRQQHVAAFDGADHVLRAAPVMGLAFGDFENDRQATSIHQRLDLGRQPAARATHATGSCLFF